MIILSLIIRTHFTFEHLATIRPSHCVILTNFDCILSCGYRFQSSSSRSSFLVLRKKWPVSIVCIRFSSLWTPGEIQFSLFFTTVQVKAKQCKQSKANTRKTQKNTRETNGKRKENTRKIQGKHKEDTGITQGKCKENARKTQEKHKKHTRNTQETRKKHKENIRKT